MYACQQAATWLVQLCRRDKAIEEEPRRERARLAERAASRASREAAAAAATADAIEVRGPIGSEDLWTEEARREANGLFNGFAPMVFAFLWGKDRLDLRFPDVLPSMVEHFSEQAAYEFIAQLRSEVFVRDFESKTLLATLRREDAARHAREPAAPQGPSGARLLIFVCNPLSEPTDSHLPNAIHDALAVNHSVGADIVGGASHTAVAADRDCSFSRLVSALTPTSGSPPWGFFFAGHADEGWLRFTTAEGHFEQPATSADDLADALPTAPALELVFLNACHSAAIARHLVRRNRARCIVCWETFVVDAAAYLFARAFFQDVAAQQRDAGAGVDYRRAFEAGKSAVTSQKRRKPIDGQSAELYALTDPSERKKLDDGKWAAGVPFLWLRDASDESDAP